MKRVLLAGGGHTHLVAGPLLAAHLGRTATIHLLAPAPALLYSGMMPGWMAGQYPFDACSIDLGRVAHDAGIGWIADTLVDVDFHAREAVGASGRRYGYDLLSLNVGSVNDRGDVTADTTARVLAAKPFATFVDGWNDWLARPPIAPRCVVVGGGAAGVEIAFALAARCVPAGPLAGGRVTLVATGDRLLAGQSSIAARLAHASLRRKGVDVRIGLRYCGADGEGAMLVDDGGRRHAGPAHLVVVANGARPPTWLAEAARSHGIAVATDGGLSVRGDLRTVGDDRVFASGDCASFVDRHVPKSGVHALRQGPPLATSIARRLAELDPALRIAPSDGSPVYRPQRRALALLNRCDGSAIAAWGPFGAAGAAWWRWKDRIDRRFIARFRSPENPDPL